MSKYVRFTFGSRADAWVNNQFGTILFIPPILVLNSIAIKLAHAQMSLSRSHARSLEQQMRINHADHPAKQ